MAEDKIIDGLNINTASKEELEAAMQKYYKDAGFYETQQLAIKTFINSVYGATASAYFVGYNKDVAEAITLQGQHLNHFSERSVNDYFKGPFQADTELHKKLGIKTEDTKKITISGGKITPTKPLEGPEFGYLNDNDSLVIAGDTDSVSWDSIIYVDGHQTVIEDAYNHFKNEVKHVILKTSSGHEVIPVKNHTTKTWNNEIVERPIKYIMRHKVSKPKWKITTVSGKSVICTGDHSIMVIRNNELIEIKPKDINPKTDKIISIK